MQGKQLVYDTLTDLGISFEAVEHPAVFTIDEMLKLDFPPDVRIAKNLFLRDAKGKRHFLVVADMEQTVDLKRMEEILSSSRLSFASDERLQKHLGLTKGAVSPFGLINDPEQQVELYLDEKLRNYQTIGVHPNDNTATVLISFEGLQKFIGATGHEVHFVDFS